MKFTPDYYFSRQTSIRPTGNSYVLYFMQSFAFFMSENHYIFHVPIPRNERHYEVLCVHAGHLVVSEHILLHKSYQQDNAV
jgi:hypothetical protein